MGRISAAGPRIGVYVPLGALLHRCGYTFGPEIWAVFVQSCAHLCVVVLVSTGWNVAV